MFQTEEHETFLDLFSSYIVFESQARTLFYMIYNIFHEFGSAVIIAKE